MIKVTLKKCKEICTTTQSYLCCYDCCVKCSCHCDEFTKNIEYKNCENKEDI